MPCCYISREFYDRVRCSAPTKLLHYNDTELPGFILEHRPTGGGTWYFRYRDASGTNRYKRLGGIKNMSLLDARAEAYAVYRLLREGRSPDELRGGCGNLPPLTLELFTEEQYLPQAKLKKRSWDMDARLLRMHILPKFRRRTMHDIRQFELVEWQNGLRNRGLAPCTCNRVLSLMKHIFNCAVRWGVLDRDKNPVSGLTPFPENSARERFLTAEEAGRLLHELDKKQGQAAAQAVKLLLHTGARKSEILGARWEHVDLERRVLTVPLSKSGKTRHIPLSDAALTVLHSLPRQNAWLFPSPQGRGHLSDVYYFWKDIRQKLGLQNVRLHDLRHFFASFLVGAGRSLYEVQKILGHYDPKVTMRYAHLSHDALVDAANTVGRAVQGGRRKHTKTERKEKRYTAPSLLHSKEENVILQE